jgi:ribosome-associated heat shock protein Hsp15
LDRVRVDVWLDVACLFKTRSEAQRACRTGRIEVNAQRAKSHREVRSGDEIIIARGHGHRQRVIVLGVAERHLSKAEARLLYRDTTPPPSPEVRAWREIEALSRPVRLSSGAPGKRDRRALRRLKGEQA